MFSSGFFLAALAVGAALVHQYLSKGPYIPWTCALFEYKCPRDIPFSGFAQLEYADVFAKFQENFNRGREVGAMVTAYVDGELVIDAYGGWQDAKKRIPYTNETLQLSWSSTKMLSAIIVAQYVEKGLLSYDEKIATYWPEFAQNNKSDVTLGDLMQHAAGVSWLDEPLSAAVAADLDQLAIVLAKQPHNFGGVRTRGYHAVTQGWCINEIIRRVDPAHRTINDIAAELNKVYNIEWYLKPHEPKFDRRIGPHYKPSPFYRKMRQWAKSLGLNLYDDADSTVTVDYDLIYRAAGISMPDQVAHTEMWKIRHVEGPAYNGYTNSRSMAKLAAMMANKGHAIVKGEPDLLNEKTWTEAMKPVPVDVDVLLNGAPSPSLRGGFGIGPGQTIDGVVFAGWEGNGGSIFWWNEEYKIGVGYTMNAMIDGVPPDYRSTELVRLLVKHVKEKKKNSV
ncbi:beta-lactamase/transpeptidase-like protein [Radiomyces spectabilis]|uniref:beta-lactamase/transpeptidase-like protein n=1 Tax=Radiomyces spectabilis TaxID=64574 RepID=UPI00221E6AED|nr:beta-lactamase/transpeptidase-like protein [Radiomyces spectabilis]KAI8391207.1 beta-lactamase/transpeptidase-like protein [Radiomyces spectabilis]